MKPENVLQSFTLFFNDIVGAVIPGALLISGLIVMHFGPLTKAQFEMLSEVWYVGVLSAFAGGHLLASAHTTLIEKPLQWVRILPASASVRANIEGSQPYEMFRATASEKGKADFSMFSLSNWGSNDIRSFAMTVSPEASAVGRRFMFIALLCNGVGAALFVLALDFLFSALWWPGLLAKYESSPPVLLQVALMIGASILCLIRGAEFQRRALSTPFSIALATLLFGEKKEKGDGKS